MASSNRLRDTLRSIGTVATLGRYRLNLVFAIAVVLLCAGVTWLIRAENSPYRTYFLNHVNLPNLWSQLHVIPLIVGILTSGNAHQPSPVGYWGAAVLMWFVIGFVASFGFSVPFHALSKALNRK